jgi:branched-chain amino acid transport system ATP-binding protein
VGILPRVLNRKFLINHAIIVEEIFSIIQKVAESGQTILLVEQNAMMAMEISHYCYVLETGLVTYEGTPEALRKQNDIARAYLG